MDAPNNHRKGGRKRGSNTCRNDRRKEFALAILARYSGRTDSNAVDWFLLVSYHGPRKFSIATIRRNDVENRNKCSIGTVVPFFPLIHLRSRISLSFSFQLSLYIFIMNIIIIIIIGLTNVIRIIIISIWKSIMITPFISLILIPILILILIRFKNRCLIYIYRQEIFL